MEEMENLVSDELKSIIVTSKPPKRFPGEEVIMAPFNKYLKRHGFGYVHFKNGGGLLTRYFIKLTRDLWHDDPIQYAKNVDLWYSQVEVEQ